MLLPDSQSAQNLPRHLKQRKSKAETGFVQLGSAHISSELDSFFATPSETLSQKFASNFFDLFLRLDITCETWGEFCTFNPSVAITN